MALALARVGGSLRIEADVLRLLGVVGRQVSRPRRARVLLARALEIYERTDQQKGAAMVLDDLGVVAHDLGELAAAREFYERALALERIVSDRRFEGITLGHLGLVAYDLGDVSLALRYYRDALDRHRESDDRRFEGFAFAFRAAAEIEQMDLDSAKQSLQAAAAIDARLGDVDSGVLLAGLHCAVAAASGDIVGAREVLARARVDLAVRDEDAIRRMLDVFAGGLAIAEARRAREEGRAQDEKGHVEAVRRAIQPGFPPASVEERFARRVVERLRDVVLGPRAPVAVGIGGTWLDAGDGKVSLGTRRSLARMLARLAEEGRAFPGRSVSIEALFAAGWPGDRALAGPARRRVYVGIDTLRALGLKAAIVQRDRGYLLDPSVDILNDL